MSSIALGLQPSLYWPGSGGGSAASAGEAQPGNLRMAHSGTVTGGFENGFLSLRTEWGSVWHIGSAWTAMLGHSGMLDRGGGLGNAPFTARWLCQEGLFTVTSSVTTYSHVFPIQYSVPPTVQVQLQQLLANVARGSLCVVDGSVTTSGFSSTISNIGSSGTHVIFWRSEGTVPL